MPMYVFFSCYTHTQTQNLGFQAGTTHIIYAVGRGTIDRVEGEKLEKKRFGLQRVQLLKPDLPSPVFPPDTWTFDIKAPSVFINIKVMSKILFVTSAQL